MNKLIIILTAVIGLSSCGTVKEEIRIYPDETADMEFSMELGKEMTESFSTSLGSLFLNNRKTDTQNNILKPKMHGNLTIMGLPVNNEDLTIDTTIYLKDLPDLQYDSLYQEVVDWDSYGRLSPEKQTQLATQLYQLLKGSCLRFRNNVPDYFLVLSLKTGKHDLQELYSMGNTLSILMADSSNSLGADEGFLFRINKKTFERGNFSFWKDIFSLAGSSSGELNFLEALLNEMKMKEFVSVVHLPGKIKSVSNSVSVISDDEHTVTTTLSREELEQGANFKNTVKFK